MHQFSREHGELPSAFPRGQSTAFEQIAVVLAFPGILRTLPLSGRRGAWGGEAESSWWPVHSRGVLEGG